MAEASPNHPSPGRLRPLLAEILFAAFLAILLMCLGYRAGVSDQVEQLPAILRRLDPTFCQGDFLTDASLAFGPREYYNDLIVAMARLVPLPWTLLLLSFLSSFGTALATMLGYRALLAGPVRAGMLAAVFVFAGEGISLGGSGAFYNSLLVPSMLVIPFTLFGAICVLRERPFAGALWSLPALLLHPLVGTIVFMVVLAAVGLYQVSNRRWKQLRVSAATGALFMLAVWLAWRGAAPKQLSTPQFEGILANFRAPHHYLPSHWIWLHWLEATVVVASLALAVFSHGTPAKLRGKLRWLGVLFLAMWCAGYVFVELLPIRSVITAQLFRYSFLPNWLLALFTSHAIFHTSDRSAAWKLNILAACGQGYRFVALSFQLWRWLTPLTKFAFALLAISVNLMAVLDPSKFQYIACLAMAYLVLPTFVRGTRWQMAAIVVVAALCLVWAAIEPNTSFPDRVALRFEDSREPSDGVALAAAKLPANARFIVPPDLGRFRLLSRHAIVVDFKAFVFTDPDMREWFRRMGDLYGPLPSGGPLAMLKLRENYDHLSDERLQTLGSKYEAQYAVVGSDVSTKLPVVSEAWPYKIVSVAATGQSPSG